MMRGDKIVIAIDLIINYAVGKEIRSNDMYALARVAGVSGRTLERAKRLFKVETKRNTNNESVWVIPKQDVDIIRNAALEVQPGLIEVIYKTLELQPDLPIAYIESGANAPIHLHQKDEYSHKVELQNNTNSQLDLSKAKRVFLICGATKFRGKFDYFAGCIPRKLESSLMNGDVMVFCDWSRTQICILQWQGNGYAQYFKRSDYGQFPWQFKRVAGAIEVHPKELEVLLEYPKLMLRLSGNSQALQEYKNAQKSVKNADFV